MELQVLTGDMNLGAKASPGRLQGQLEALRRQSALDIEVAVEKARQLRTCHWRAIVSPLASWPSKVQSAFSHLFTCQAVREAESLRAVEARVAQKSAVEYQAGAMIVRRSDQRRRRRRGCESKLLCSKSN